MYSARITITNPTIGVPLSQVAAALEALEALGFQAIPEFVNPGKPTPPKKAASAPGGSLRLDGRPCEARGVNSLHARAYQAIRESRPGDSLILACPAGLSPYEWRARCTKACARHLPAGSYACRQLPAGETLIVRPYPT